MEKEEEDIELKNFLEMELSFKHACMLHLQYVNHVTLTREEFKRNCPHKEFEILENETYFDNTHYEKCIRCGKIKLVEE